MIRAGLICMALGLAACERDAGEAAPSPAGPAAILPHALPPAGDAAPRFVGRWAAADENCAAQAWTFRADGLSTPGEVSCAFAEVREAAGGYDIAASCTAEAPPAPYEIELRFAQSARAMLIEGGPMAPIGLIYCGP